MHTADNNVLRYVPLVSKVLKKFSSQSGNPQYAGNPQYGAKIWCKSLNMVQIVGGNKIKDITNSSRWYR